ncbi:MAG TPA: NAD-dependent epimerase/dehydratase family protein [Myxococcota bacterium]|nr:NAD-dependent epimerase/dehydratase family protein [Myxococcota bacterium]
MRALVTGGSGFLGRAIVRRLLDRGAEVRSLSRGSRPGSEIPGVEPVRGDVADAEILARALAGCEIVFHTAARVGGWGPWDDYQRTNVEGTARLISACRRQGVRKLVYTSTPSVVHGGGDIEGGDESLPYASRFEAAYPETKARAERLVLASHDETLATVALRPHLIWGPGDPHLIPRLLDRARAGRLWLVGTGDQLVDATFLDNAADAHLLAADRLAPDAACAGRAYFIANGEPAPVRELIDGVLAAAGLPPVTRRMPARMAWLAGAAAELAAFGLRRREEPPITRFAARQLATAHWYDLGAARRDLGYAPIVSTAEGLRRLQTHLAGQATASESESGARET